MIRAVREPGRTIPVWDALVRVLHWSLVLTVAFGCWVTAVMKGPRYTADSFPVDSPRQCDD